MHAKREGGRSLPHAGAAVDAPAARPADPIDAHGRRHEIRTRDPGRSPRRSASSDDGLESIVPNAGGCVCIRCAERWSAAGARTVG